MCRTEMRIFGAKYGRAIRKNLRHGRWTWSIPSPTVKEVPVFMDAPMARRPRATDRKSSMTTFRCCAMNSHGNPRLLMVAGLLACFAVARGEEPRKPKKGDWPMWGGSPDRNMVSDEKGIPTKWDIKTKTNIKWTAPLGSQTYGNPVIANGKLF